MGNIMSAIYDDECEWDNEKHKLEISDVSWSPYSRETRLAKEGNATFGFRGARLRLYIKHSIQKEDLEKAQAAELKIFEEMFK